MRIRDRLPVIITTVPVNLVRRGPRLLRARVRQVGAVQTVLVALVVAACGVSLWFLAMQETREAGAQILVALILAIGTFRTLQVTREGQLTDRYTRAIAQLGDDKPEVRLGAIYALERIVRDSPRDHDPVIEILSAYARRVGGASEHPWRGEDPSAKRAFAQVIQRARPLADPGLDLSGVDLSNTMLVRANLAFADLTDANLAGAKLGSANLSFADLTGANLAGAKLFGTDLTRAQLDEARVDGAIFSLARLEGASLQHLVGEASTFESASFDDATKVRFVPRDRGMVRTSEYTSPLVSPPDYFDYY